MTATDTSLVDDAPDATTEAVVAAGLIAVLRAGTARHFRAVTEILVEAGVRVVEVTLTTPDAVPVLAELTSAFDDEVIIGAGTVMTADQAEACVAAGARFLVSPTASPDVIAAARVAGVPAYPGALTPTEIVTAHRSGAPAVKLFPASAVGPRFVRELHGPCPDIPLIPSGGIEPQDVAAWLAAGAAAVGLGSPLIGPAGEHGPDRGLAERARAAVTAVVRARRGT